MKHSIYCQLYNYSYSYYEMHSSKYLPTIQTTKLMYNVPYFGSIVYFVSMYYCFYVEFLNFLVVPNSEIYSFLFWNICIVTTANKVSFRTSYVSWITKQCSGFKVRAFINQKFVSKNGPWHTQTWLRTPNKTQITRSDARCTSDNYGTPSSGNEIWFWGVKFYSSVCAKDKAFMS